MIWNNLLLTREDIPERLIMLPNTPMKLRQLFKLC